MQTVTIFGVGLIGGSFALALKRAGFKGKILGVSSPSTLERAISLGVVDAGASLAEAASQSDLIYLAQPISRILEILPELDLWVRPEALITDAGSTKGAIVEKANASIRRCQFLGGHPLAGKESRGVESSDATLFDGRTYVFTPSEPSEIETDAARELLCWVRRIGSIPLITNASEHDRTVAFTSHLPQLASTALANLLNKSGSNALRIFGPALLDSTRLALSPFDIWSDIIATNTEEIDAALSAYINSLEYIRGTLRASGPARCFEDGAAFAAKIRKPH